MTRIRFMEDHPTREQVLTYSSRWPRIHLPVELSRGSEHAITSDPNVLRHDAWCRMWRGALRNANRALRRLSASNRSDAYCAHRRFIRKLRCSQSQTTKAIEPVISRE